jgi:DDE superfamily endonuclease
MLLLPATIVALLAPFAPLFSRPVWRHVQVLLVGAILTPGRRMVSSALRAVGLSHLSSFRTYHRVLNRAVWSSRSASRILLGLLVGTFVPTGPLVLGIDETIERRRGKKIAAAGIYRDPVRSSHSHFVKVRGLRWICLMLLVPIPWAGRVWALPFLSVLAPSERAARRRNGRFKPLTAWARQMIRQVHRWQPDRELVVVGDRTYAALELLDAVRSVATVVTRLRLDARLFAPAPPRLPHQQGRPRLVGERLPNLTHHVQDLHAVWAPLVVSRWYGEYDRHVAVLSQIAIWYSTGFPPVPIRWVLIRDPRGSFSTQALLCTELNATPQQILAWFVRRWQVEVTFHEVRTHLGVETQRQWAEAAILRTTPALFGIFSLVTVHAHHAYTRLTYSSSAADTTDVRQSAWYTKATPTFADALALVRRELWTHTTFCGLPRSRDSRKIPRALVDHLTDLLCYAT